ncbi:ABC transporter ATP-binding protein [Candidatus Bathyarchaeota archaeon]|nr:ABC transporter ATP-binding protein [Candidatus Bathyarchaeota archaeon]
MEIPEQVGKYKNVEMMLVTTIVEAVDLKKTYMLGKVPVNALRGVNLKVESGDFLAILGPSGSGKSTLLNLIGALDKPTEGNMLIEGVDVSTLNENQLADLRRRIGFVFQFFNLIPRFTARENVELSMAIAALSKADRRRRTEDLLETVGLRERMNHRPAELSGGEQQRVAIARALANNPKFLLMDEPTGNIDSKTASEIIGLIKRLSEEKGVTIIMVTHDQRLAGQAKRIVQMFDGLIVQEVMN